MIMWQRFTERARRVVFFAQEEAGRLGENLVSTEHLLLGLVRENDCVAACILDRLGVRLDHVRSEIERQVVRGDGRLGQDMQLSPRAKRVIDFSYDEARQLDNNYIGTEHILLGLVREEEGIAGKVLLKLGATLEAVRREAVRVQAENKKDEAASSQNGGMASDEIQIGDLGTLASPENRAGIEVAVDPAAFQELADVFLARDGYGYQELLDLGRVFVAAAGERVKNLVVPRDSTVVAQRNIRLFVRLLEGVHEGRKGWIAADSFTLIGPDETPFPPYESDLTLDPEADLF